MINSTFFVSEGDNSSASQLYGGEQTVKNKQVISFEVREMSEQTVYVVMLFVCMLGMVTNGINIRVFLHQGVRSDSTTAFMFCLALSDFAACCTMVPTCVCYVIKLVDYVTYRNCYMATILPFKIPHIVFARTTGWATVCISFERALSVLLPLKVKELTNPVRSILAVFFFFLFFLISNIPWYASVQLLLRYSTRYNATLITLKTSPLTKKATEILFIQNNFILSTAAMVIVAMTTVAMVVQLYAARKRRINTLGYGKTKSHQKSSKEIEVVKAVALITGVYLLCMSANHIQSNAFLFIEGYSLSGQNSNLFSLLHTFNYLFNCVNSAINFFIYIKVSSKYRATFKAIFLKSSK